MGEWLVLNRNKKVPDHLIVRTEDRGGTKLLLNLNLNWSARRDLTVLTYCFLSLGLMETSAWG